MDHWVDRPEVQARQRAQPTGTNRPTRTTHTHTPTHTRTSARARRGGRRTRPRVHYAAQNQPTHPPTRGPATRGRAPHPTTVPAATAGGETPGPIPNPEAKPPSANGTAPTRERKSRTPPEHTPPARAGPAPQPGAHPHTGQTHKHTRRTPPPHGRRDAAKAAKGEETQRGKPRWRAPTSPVGSLTPITPPATLTET